MRPQEKRDGSRERVSNILARKKACNKTHRFTTGARGPANIYLVHIL